MLIFASRSARNIGDFVAQLVEQYTFNVWALGSSPSGITRTKNIALRSTYRGAFVFFYWQMVFVCRFQ